MPEKFALKFASVRLFTLDLLRSNVKSLTERVTETSRVAYGELLGSNDPTVLISREKSLLTCFYRHLGVEIFKDELPSSHLFLGRLNGDIARKEVFPVFQ